MKYTRQAGTKQYEAVRLEGDSLEEVRLEFQESKKEHILEAYQIMIDEKFTYYLLVVAGINREPEIVLYNRFLTILSVIVPEMWRVLSEALGGVEFIESKLGGTDGK